MCGLDGQGASSVKFLYHRVMGFFVYILRRGKVKLKRLNLFVFTFSVCSNEAFVARAERMKMYIRLRASRRVLYTHHTAPREQIVFTSTLPGLLI